MRPRAESTSKVGPILILYAVLILLSDHLDGGRISTMAEWSAPREHQCGTERACHSNTNSSPRSSSHLRGRQRQKIPCLYNGKQLFPAFLTEKEEEAAAAAQDQPN